MFAVKQANTLFDTVELNMTECKLNPAICAMNDPLQTRFHYYQPGDLIVGGMTSQYLSMSERVSFEEYPKTKIVDEPM
ncbi:UNVERIFIED_CONTAM: hypothetical protein K2H54_033594 [Gekko kuhli]